MGRSIGAAAGRWSGLGMAFRLTGLVMAEFFLLCWVLLTLMLAACWIGLPLFVGAMDTVRTLADRRRRWTGECLGVTIERHYRPLPEHGWLPRFTAVVTDPASWRDIRWLFVDCTLGLSLCLVPVALVLAGVLGVALPLIWLTLPVGASLDFPFGLRVTDVASASSISVPNGIIYLVACWLLTLPMMRWYANLTRALLQPGERSRLSERVEQLASSRAHTIDHQASELRRIERDLHDGAQANLVALGMSLGLVEELLTDDPQTRALLA
jgi:signal transduction histidine kinase